MFKTKKYSIERDFRVTEQVLGRGQDGNILLLIEKETGKKYALKMLQETEANRIQIALQLKAAMSSRSIVKIKDVYQDPYITDHYLVVME